MKNYCINTQYKYRTTQKTKTVGKQKIEKIIFTHSKVNVCRGFIFNLFFSSTEVHWLMKLRKNNNGRWRRFSDYLQYGQKLMILMQND